VSLPAKISATAELALGSSITSSTPVSGGCINDAWHCVLADGRDVFIKSNPGADSHMFPREAEGLVWLAEADALRIPNVLAVSRPGDRACFLVLEYLRPGRASGDYAEQLGRGLAAMHGAHAEAFGALGHEENFLATLVQDNRPLQSWVDFYRDRRLEPQVQLAIESGHAPQSWTALFDRLYARLDELCGPAEPPARLHGDLWSGNLHCTESGSPALIDPAVYGGHREIDLAMLRLFGSPSHACFDAYHEAYPLAHGHEDRVELYQIYPLLAHVNLFGSSYVAQVESALRRYL